MRNAIPSNVTLTADRQQNAQEEDQERSQSISYEASSYYYKKYPNHRILPFEVVYRAAFHGYIGECTQDRHHRQHTDQHFDRMDQSIRIYINKSTSTKHNTQKRHSINVRTRKKKMTILLIQWYSNYNLECSKVES